MPAIKIKQITMAQWVAALRILQGKAATSDAKLFPAGDLKHLRAHLRGPFAKGMPQEAAMKVIDYMGWRVPNSGRQPK